MYSSMLDPYEPPRTRPVYDNPQVVQRPRSLLSRLVGWLPGAGGARTLPEARRAGCTCEAGALVALDQHRP